MDIIIYKKVDTPRREPQFHGYAYIPPEEHLVGDRHSVWVDQIFKKILIRHFPILDKPRFSLDTGKEHGCYLQAFRPSSTELIRLDFLN